MYWICLCFVLYNYKYHLYPETKTKNYTNQTHSATRMEANEFKDLRGELSLSLVVLRLCMI